MQMYSQHDRDTAAFRSQQIRAATVFAFVCLVNYWISFPFPHIFRFHHPILGRVEEGFQTEVDVVTQLLHCQAQVSEWHFLPALLSLHSANSKLIAWGQLFQRQRETRKHLFGGQSQKAVQPPHLYTWLQRFQALLLAKFSFYFHEALSRQTTPTDMRALTTRTTPDYHGKICSFIRKHDASNVSLVFDNRGSESFQGHGYHHPHSYREAPKGVEQFPAVVSLPTGERPLTHWPNVIMMMGDRAAELNTLDKVVHFYDDKVQSTYYLTRPEPHFTLVVIFDGRKSEKDLHIAAFLQEISGSLRNSKPFSTLKPGSKSWASAEQAQKDMHNMKYLSSSFSTDELVFHTFFRKNKLFHIYAVTWYLSNSQDKINFKYFCNRYCFKKIDLSYFHFAEVQFK